jgi:hypothetical protein
MKRRFFLLAVILFFSVLVFSYLSFRKTSDNQVPVRTETTPITPIVSVSPVPTETDRQLLDQLNESTEPNFDLQFQKIQSEFQ